MLTSRPLQSSPSHVPSTRSYVGTRPLVLSVAKIIFLMMPYLSSVASYPTPWTILPTLMAADDSKPMPSSDPTLWIYMAVAVGLVLLGGAFAGLTIALMGQDEIYLQVIKTSGEAHERKHATSVLRLLKKGKHWVLVTLLLGNVITNETLPIVLDRSLGGGWPAVLGSTVLIVIFGEIIPQSVCVRYGLPIGAWMSPLVLILMWILAPVAWPTAKLLDRLLGEDHGTTYKKAGLKTLVTLHKSLGAAGEQLNEDEVTIISAVLDLKAKAVGNIMTPMADVFTMSADTVLDEDTMEIILRAGYSRIPIYAPDNQVNFVGMLLVKILITYDPEDCKRVSDFALATLPETRAETSCLDIVNFFQEGKSHMVLVSSYPGDDHGALGVVTLEDVIEELIGEEIIDESDVFIDVHKAIRRLAPAPKYRVPKGAVVTDHEHTISDSHGKLIDVESDDKDFKEVMEHNAPDHHKHNELRLNGSHPELAASPRSKQALRRASSVANYSDREGSKPRQMTPELREQFKRLGPSNLASRPRSTRYNTVKIKPGPNTFADSTRSPEHGGGSRRASSVAAQGGVGAGLLSSAGKDASDGVLAVQAGYGTMSPTGSKRPRSQMGSLHSKASGDAHQSKPSFGGGDFRPRSFQRSRTGSHSTLGTMDSNEFKFPSYPRKSIARSGSITEQIVEQGGIRKTVLELTSSSSEQENGNDAGGSGGQGKSRDGSQETSDEEGIDGKENEQARGGGGGRKKRRRKKRKSTVGDGGAWSTAKDRN